MGFFDKLKNNISGVFSSGKKLDDEFFSLLEETLILSDMGAVLADEITENLRKTCKKENITDADYAKEELRKILIDILEETNDRTLDLKNPPTVILIIGVNGVGKTTSIGKLALGLKRGRRKVLLCAGDTFRAAAADQLEIWSHRADVPIIRRNEGADPAAVLFDAITKAKEDNIDVIICDTAGRLHNKQNLMKELEKMNRIISRELPNSSRETLLCLDATTGQNGLSQVSGFAEIANISGIILTKLDGTAKGGIVFSVARSLGVPVKFIGVGEKVEDLRPFDPPSFVGEIV